MKEKMMIRAQVRFSEAQYERIRVLARRLRISFAEAVRRLVDAGMVRVESSDKPVGPRALLEIAGIGASGLGDLGRRHDDYLGDACGK